MDPDMMRGSCGQIKLQVLQWCCSVVARFPHPQKQIHGKYIGNASGQRQHHGSVAFELTVYIRCTGHIPLNR